MLKHFAAFPCLATLALLTFAAAAQAQDAASLLKIVNSGTCPQDLKTLQNRSVRPDCGGLREGTAALRQCQSRIAPTNDNEAITRYNIFVRACGSRKPKISGPATDSTTGY